MDHDLFQLSAQPRPATSKKQYDADPMRQTVLFAGLDCLPGQRDLFETDGPDKELG